ncbi:hypothetical protein [Lentibacillus amyloliquefaciens]|uniref:Uncharacterized protein n=1 Tax=Lentibacillus amyloliquefaciens TaxID=1472767 RepID=A0A0U4DU42_9BACI|nr:hypothetical protein [Lentibacillus amyloliquefaciens]ALX48888.1 hypothetical protein AOX59_09840 [Lentibacillus amyloliquefaciens]
MGVIGMGLIVNLIFFAAMLYIAYLIISVAVRHGIDNSELGKLLKQKHSYQEEKFQPKNDLDKD